MPKVYSKDLREKVMQSYNSTGHKSKTCMTFNIARTTLDDWTLLQKQTGQLAQPKFENMGRPSVILDLGAFKNFVENTPFSQAKDLVPLFKKHFGYEVSYSVLLSRIHKIGWSNKKIFLYRQACKLTISVFSWLLSQWKNTSGTENIFYIDESGINSTDQAEYG